MLWRFLASAPTTNSNEDGGQLESGPLTNPIQFHTQYKGSSDTSYSDNHTKAMKNGSQIDRLWMRRAKTPATTNYLQWPSLSPPPHSLTSFLSMSPSLLSLRSSLFSLPICLFHWPHPDPFAQFSPKILSWWVWLLLNFLLNWYFYDSVVDFCVFLVPR